MTIFFLVAGKIGLRSMECSFKRCSLARAPVGVPLCEHLAILQYHILCPNLFLVSSASPGGRASDHSSLSRVDSCLRLPVAEGVLGEPEGTEDVGKPSKKADSSSDNAEDSEASISDISNALDEHCSERRVHPTPYHFGYHNALVGLRYVPPPHPGTAGCYIPSFIIWLRRRTHLTRMETASRLQNFYRVDILS